MSLPIVPEGVNPWTVYLTTLSDTLYKHPSAGFRERLIVLLALNGVIVVLAIAFLLTLVAEGRDKGSWRKALWLFRLTPRRAGTYIITNTKLFCSLCTIAYGALNFATLMDDYHVFLNGARQNNSSGLRSMGFIPLFAQGWLVTWGSLQATLLTSDTGMSPFVANALFVILGSALLLGALAAAIVNTLAGNSTWNHYEFLVVNMRANEETWVVNSNSTLPQLLALKPAFDSLTADAAYNRITQIAQLAVMTLVPLIVIAVNAGSLRLAAIIRQQLAFNIQTLNGLNHGGESTFALKSLKTVETVERRQSVDLSHVERLEKNERGLSVEPKGMERRGSREERLSSSSSGDKRGSMEKRLSVDKRASVEKRGSVGGRNSVGKTHLTRGEMKLLARRGSEHDRERLKHIQALQKAERDLVIIASIIMIALTIIAGLCIYVLVLCIQDRLGTASWTEFEIVLTGTNWVYEITMLCIFLGLLWNTFAARHLTSTTDTVFASATRANTTLNSTLGLHPVDSLTSVDYGPPAPPSSSSPKGPAKELLPYQWPRRDDGGEGSHVEVDMERLEDEPRAGVEARRESDGLAESALVAQRRRPSFERRPSFDLHQ